jgi:hypothetical protein
VGSAAQGKGRKMDRDPKNAECTRDPIFLLQVGRRKWTQVPDGMGYDGDSMWVEDTSEVPDWMMPFLAEDGTVDTTEGFWTFVENEDNDNGWPFVVIDWNTEHVFLTRDEAETFAKTKSHRWDKWRVYCVPAEGQLARVLNQA